MFPGPVLYNQIITINGLIETCPDYMVRKYAPKTGSDAVCDPDPLNKEEVAKFNKDDCEVSDPTKVYQCQR